MSEIVNPGNSARAASQQHGGGYLQGHCYARLAGLWQKNLASNRVLLLPAQRRSLIKPLIRRFPGLLEHFLHICLITILVLRAEHRQSVIADALNYHLYVRVFRADSISQLCPKCIKRFLLA